MSRSRWRNVLIATVVVALAYGAWHAWSVRWMCDDAYISARYAGNLADGHGLIFNPGAPDERVEGFSNLLWTLLLALGLWLGVPEVVPGGVGAAAWGLEMYAAVLGLLSWSGVIAVLLAWSRRMHRSAGVAWLPLAAVAMALHHHWATLALSGLETGMFTLLVTAMAWRTATAATTRHYKVLGVLAALAALTRPDGAIPAVVAACWSLLVTLRAGPGNPLRRAFSAYAIPSLGLFVPIWIWKWSYYGSPVPNTALAKSAGDGRLEQGLEYLLLNLETYWVLGVALVAGGVAVILGPRSRGLAEPGSAVGPSPVLRTIAAYGFPYLLFVAWVGGDFMHTRFVLPVTPLVFLLLDAAWSRSRNLGTQHPWVLPFGVALVGSATLLDRRPAFLDDYLQPVSDNRAISFAPFIPGADGPQGNSRIRYIRQCGLMLRELCEGLDVRIAVPGGEANLAHYGDFPVAIETANGLTDRFIASLPSAGSNKVGHDRSWQQFPGYLQSRGVDITFDLGWQAGDKLDQGGARTIVLAHPNHPGVEIEGRLVTWEAELLQELQRRSPLVRLPPFPQALDVRYFPIMAQLSNAEVRADYEALKLYYFDHTDDPVREQLFKQRLGK